MVAWWAEQYFRYAVTASPACQKVQRRDLARFRLLQPCEVRTSVWRAAQGTDSCRAEHTGHPSRVETSPGLPCRASWAF